MALVMAGWVMVALALGALWWRQLQTRNATSVDVAWSFALAGLSLLYAVGSDGALARRALVGLLGAGWAVRLGGYLLLSRVLGETEEDGRYQALRSRWGAAAPRNFFFFYQAQAVVAVLFSLPIWAAMRGGPPDGWAIAGALVWMIAVFGEATADRQLARFRADPANRGEVCQVGLWRFSRHPNYFFEWIHWWSYVLIGHAAALTWVGPVVMLFFLFRVSGIPYTEAQALRSRGERYRDYQRTTSVFVPWFPRGSR